MQSLRATLPLFLCGLFCCVQREAKLIKLPLNRRKTTHLRSGIASNASLESMPVPMHGNLPTMGEYYVDVVVGGFNLSLIVDTGSADVGVASVGCSGCTKKFNDPYDPLKSSTAEPFGCDWCSAHQGKGRDISCKARPEVTGKQCVYIISYVDGSGYSASLWNDTFAFGLSDTTASIPLSSSHRSLPSSTKSVPPHPMLTAAPPTDSVIGAMYFAKFPNPKEVDGIVGMADSSVSVSGSRTPLDDLVAAGEVDNVFSICLHDEGGVLYLGSDEKEQRSAGLLGLDATTQWTPRVPKSGYYGVNMLDIVVDGVSIGVDPSVYNDGTAIVDSGSSAVSIPETAFSALKSTFGKLCKTRCLKGVCDCTFKKPLQSTIFNGRCDLMSKQDIARFPDVQIKMEGGVVVDYNASDYLQTGTTFCDKGGFYTTAFSSMSDGSGTILGDSFMKGYVVIHDRRAPQRIGFAPVTDQNCP